MNSYLLYVRFERCAENASWEKGMWAIKLNALLTGRADSRLLCNVAKILDTFLEPMFFCMLRTNRTKLWLVPFFLMGFMAAILNFKMATNRTF